MEWLDSYEETHGAANSAPRWTMADLKAELGPLGRDQGTAVAVIAYAVLWAGICLALLAWL